MSDKKQPAQQRVNVRIVKADDPEQRGGMKPIAKADGSLQISPEEACTAGIWTKPPFDLRGLSKMVDESTILPQCIRAYKSNIAGFGIDIRYKDDFADADETPEMKAEWDRAAEVVEMPNDQTNIDSMFAAITLGASEYPYHPDGGKCVMYSAADIITLYSEYKSFVTKQTTYCNALRQWAKRETDPNVIGSIYYGCALPEDLEKEVGDILSAAQAQITAIINKLSA